MRKERESERERTKDRDEEKESARERERKRERKKERKKESERIYPSASSEFALVFLSFSFFPSLFVWPPPPSFTLAHLCVLSLFMAVTVACSLFFLQGVKEGGREEGRDGLLYLIRIKHFVACIHARILTCIHT